MTFYEFINLVFSSFPDGPPVGLRNRSAIPRGVSPAGLGIVMTVISSGGSCQEQSAASDAFLLKRCVGFVPEIPVKRIACFFLDYQKPIL